jgi:predicted O-methyltransferase YrrM
MSHVLRPVSVLELGTSLGISSAYLALGNPECPVVTVEGCSETAAFAKEQLDTLGLNNIRVINSRFEDVLSYLLPEIGVLGMVFFDGNHRKEATMDYFQQCLPFIHDETVFIFDDIHWSSEMEEAWAVIREHESVKITIDLFRMGLVFFREGLSKEDFILRF